MSREKTTNRPEWMDMLHIEFYHKHADEFKGYDELLCLAAMQSIADYWPRPLVCSLSEEEMVALVKAYVSQTLDQLYNMDLAEDSELEREDDLPSVKEFFSGRKLK